MLLKFVLASILIGYLSFFKVPASIVSLLESLYKVFLWGK